MNPDLHAALERHHARDGEGIVCAVCAEWWPCDASRALEALDAAIQIHEPTEKTVCDGMPWPARCRWCDLVTEDPDGFFCPSDTDAEVVDEFYRCSGSPTGLHEPKEPTE